MKLRIISCYGRKDCGQVEIVDGNVILSGVDQRLTMMFYKMFEDDFDESLGFPPVRVRAKKGSLGAVLAATQYLKNLGFLVLAEDAKAEI